MDPALVLTDFFAGKNMVLEAYLFGSQARGDARANSDIDVAVYVDTDSRLEQFEIQMSLLTDLTTLFATENVDLVVLNSAKPLLYHRVLRDGIRVHCQDLVATTCREAAAMSRYADDLGRMELIRQVIAEQSKPT